VGEFLPGYEASGWFGIGAPKNTPVEIIEKLNREINAGLADPKIKARVGDLGGAVLALSPADFGKLIAEETEEWAKVIKFAAAFYMVGTIEQAVEKGKKLAAEAAA
jgi:tripartite-type tricarboxylate transporter receptor subunit TctC